MCVRGACVCACVRVCDELSIELKCTSKGEQHASLINTIRIP